MVTTVSGVGVSGAAAGAWVKRAGDAVLVGADVSEPQVISVAEATPMKMMATKPKPR